MCHLLWNAPWNVITQTKGGERSLDKEKHTMLSREVSIQITWNGLKGWEANFCGSKGGLADWLCCTFPALCKLLICWLAKTEDKDCTINWHNLNSNYQAKLSGKLLSMLWINNRFAAQKKLSLKSLVTTESPLHSTNERNKALLLQNNVHIQSLEDCKEKKDERSGLLNCDDTCQFISRLSWKRRKVFTMHTRTTKPSQEI